SQVLLYKPQAAETSDVCQAAGAPVEAALSGDAAGIHGLAEVEFSSDRADGGGLARQTDQVANPVGCFDSSAVRAEEILNAELAHFSRGPLQLFVVELEQVKSADGRVNRSVPHRLARIFECIDDAGVAASRNHDQAAFSVDHERHIFRNRIVYH